LPRKATVFLGEKKEKVVAKGERILYNWLVG
jgi:hypothetical protein